MKAKPFIKWVGGKTQLLEEINNNLPNNLENIETYIEPFIGGGAVMFDIVPKLPNIINVIINDLNYKLTNTYSIIKTNHKELINYLKQLQKEYYEHNISDKELMFYDIRNSFNIYKCETIEDKIYRAAEFIFLNKTGFNGLYRENSKGEFNVPWNKSEQPLICDEDNLNAVHNFLIEYNVQILTGIYYTSLYNNAIQIMEPYKTLVYFDPPYRALTKSSAFTAYTKSGFNDDNQVELQKYCDSLTEAKVYFMLSNSDPKNSDPDDTFFDDLYNGYQVKRINARRSINSKGTGRGAITEILVKNYITTSGDTYYPEVHGKLLKKYTLKSIGGGFNKNCIPVFQYYLYDNETHELCEVNNIEHKFKNEEEVKEYYQSKEN